jgi:hypothetical protein
MVLSHSKKFLFIHVYKVAGTSISKELAKYSSLILPSIRAYRFLSRKMPYIFPNKYPRHATALQMKRVIAPDAFNSYFKFAFVRNPWDWQVSMYHYILEKKTHHLHQKVRSLKDFPTYIDWYVHTPVVTNQKDILSDEDGTYLMDFAGKFENLNEDFDHICDRIGIPRIELPHLNATKKKKYQAFYTDNARDQVRQYFHKDVEFFQYEF